MGVAIKEATTNYAPDKTRGCRLVNPCEHLNVLVLVLNVKDTPEMPIVLLKRLQVTCVNVLPDVIICCFLHLNA
jgi:hypothetical protein